MLGLAKVPGAEAKAAGIVRLETRIATAHWSREASGDVDQGATTTGPGRSSAPRRRGSTGRRTSPPRGLARAPRFVVWQPSAVTGISALTASEPLEAWKDYLTFHAIQSRAAVLPGAFDREAFAFFGPVLTRRQEAARPVEARGRRHQRRAGLRGRAGCTSPDTSRPAEKARARAMVANIIAAFRSRIDRLDWMAPATKKEAKAKLAVLKVGVGYPDKWPGYRGLEVVKPATPTATRSAPGCSSYRRSLEQLGQPVDRAEWVMTPQTVNAVNLPAMNAHELPRGDPAAALLRSQAARWRWTTAPSGPSSATR